ncbi:MFS transporter [Luteipulveratus flavus]|uniref:MFS transporter n=1 Tax=Luteipulveratus flavus TaxID=3031728 RepID=A0ABT6C7M0_9MICO|nr:MFS transporter [Luteipulveratus sp. YIM 133296]MDF8264934.1 MFS transporter [Luteipulveratus sp. YIM 133296]
MTTSAPLRADPDFRRYWAARTVSVAGSLATLVALPVLVYRLTGSAALTAITTTLEAAPYLIFGLFAGAIADRHDRQRVMVAADLANAAVISSVPLAWWLGHLTVVHALVVAFTVQSLFTFFDGANFGALPVLVGSERIGAANSAIFGVGGVLDLVMPASVGLLLAVWSPATILALDAASFVASALLVRSIGRPLSVPREHAGPLRPAAILRDVREGVGFLWRHVGVRTTTAVGTLQSIAGAAFMSLAVAFSDRVLGVGTSGWRFGLLYSVWGIGGIVAAALVPRLLGVTSPGRLVAAALPFSGVAGVAVALSPSWAAAVTAMVVWGVAYQVVLIASLTYRQQVTPEAMLGRVNMAGRMLSWGIGWTAGSLGAGALARLVDVRAAMVALTCAGLVAAALAWLSPLRRQPDPAAA